MSTTLTRQPQRPRFYPGAQSTIPSNPYPASYAPAATHAAAAAPVKPAAVKLEHVSRVFGTGPMAAHALNDITIGFATGEFTAVMGPSGAGKTTLLQCAAGLDTVTAGTVTIGETKLSGAKTKKLDAVRRKQAGFIFQQYNLLPMLTIYENVVLSLRLRSERVRKAEAVAVLESVGLHGLAKRLPSQLSGGQQQRAAIARCLLAQPDVIFADEPTGALDQASGKHVLGLLRQAVDRDRRTVVMVTHDPRVAAWADRVIFIVDGQVHSDIAHPTVESVSAELARWEA